MCLLKLFLTTTTTPTTAATPFPTTISASIMYSSSVVLLLTLRRFGVLLVDSLFWFSTLGMDAWQIPMSPFLLGSMLYVILDSPLFCVMQQNPLPNSLDAADLVSSRRPFVCLFQLGRELSGANPWSASAQGR